MIQEYSKIGFSGTQDGMTLEQRSKFVYLPSELFPDELHHGDCIGADNEADDAAMTRKMKIVVHPPINPKKQAFCNLKPYSNRIVLSPRDYIDRNHDIVDQTECLVATPKNNIQLGSGTWSTINYARKQNKDVFVVWPNGKITLNNESWHKEYR